VKRRAAPKFLYRLHAKLVERTFERRSRRHGMALALFEFALERFEHMALFGDLGLLSIIREKFAVPTRTPPPKWRKRV